MTYEDLVNTITEHAIKLDKPRLQRVYAFASAAHEGQLRQTGEPYIAHPLFVANTLASWDQPQPVLEAALLHDVVEDTGHTLPEIEKAFGAEVAFLVDGVTKIGQVKLRSSVKAEFVENLRKMFIAMAKDTRVVLIRLADRHHNMLTLDALPLIKQKRIALETLEVYAPLAERLGMGQIKGELEDLAFPYLYPEEYKKISKLAADHFERAAATTGQAIRAIKTKLAKANIKAEVKGRFKRKYSLFKKLSRPEIDYDFSKIHDLVALRVITQTKADCYAALGVVHSLWRPAPNFGVSDYIALPKPNGYQSIHTKVMNHGQLMEVQIRSVDMHYQADYGAAAHSLYSDAKNHGASEEKLKSGTAFKLKKKMAWVEQLATWQNQVKNSEEFLADLKLDALSERIYVFSPLGDVFDLPILSTPVDFAIAVHGDLGFHIQSAKVNSRLVPLDHRLNNGDIVEIIRSKVRHLPNRDWLRFVKTSRARIEIKRALGLTHLDKAPK